MPLSRRQFLLTIYVVAQALFVLVLGLVTWPLDLLLVGAMGSSVQVVAGIWLLVIPVQTVASAVAAFMAVYRIWDEHPDADHHVRLAVVLSLPSYVTLGLLTFILVAAGAVTAMGSLVLYNAAVRFAYGAAVFSVVTLVFNVWILFWAPLEVAEEPEAVEPEG